ncbi:MAG: hypothetical protein ACRDZQ_14865, partial [Acidimicrobiales bacterium]
CCQVARPPARGRPPGRVPHPQLVAPGGRLPGPAVGTNDDATFPTADGPLPGAGALLAAVARASGATPTVAGKPYQPVVALLRQRVGDVEVMVGDRPSTDGMLAERMG